MSKDLTDVDAFSSPITVPEGMDSHDDAAGDVESIAQRLADRTHHLNEHAAKKDVANTFTAAPQVIDVNEHFTPLIESTKHAADGGDPNANWKLLFQGRMDAATQRKVRMYWGPNIDGDEGGFIVTINALYSNDTSDQWYADDDGFDSCAFIVREDEIEFVSHDAGAEHWNWAHDTGNIRVGAATVGGTLAAVTVRANEYQYVPIPTRDWLQPLFESFGEGVLDGTGVAYHILFLAAAKVHIWPIRLPHDSTLTKVEAVVSKAGTGTATLRVFRKQGFDFGNPPSTMPNDFDNSGGWVDNESGSGFRKLEVSLSQVIDNTGAGIQMFALIVSGDGGDRCYGLRYTFTDPGPRSH